MDETREQETAPEIQNNWKTYAAPVVGALIILVVLLGGYWLWQRRATIPTKPAEQTQIAQVQDQTPSPKGEVTLPQEDNTQEPQEEAEEEKGQEQEAQAQGGTEKGGKLPETGFPTLWLLIPSALALAGGFKLRKSRN